MLPDVKVFISSVPTDMRRSFDGLAALVQEGLKKDLFKGELFVFFNRRVDRVKILYWDRNGYCLWSKRLEKGIFRLPKVPGKAFSMGTKELGLLLEGIDLTERQRLVAI